MHYLVTVENMRKALSILLVSREGAEKEWIDQIAEFVMDFFGFEDRILDNRLTPRDRDVFYMLEGMGLLKTEMEEATIHKGKTWRIHYWILNTEKIRELLLKNERMEDEEENFQEGSIYENLSENVWNQHR